jgi:hypothetical protein
MPDVSDEELNSKLNAYLDGMLDKKRLLRSHFLNGLAKGVGMAVGFSILGAILIIVLQNLATRNLPLIGDFLAQLMEIVKEVR